MFARLQMLWFFMFKFLFDLIIHHSCHVCYYFFLCFMILCDEVIYHTGFLLTLLPLHIVVFDPLSTLISHEDCTWACSCKGDSFSPTANSGSAAKSYPSSDAFIGLSISLDDCFYNNESDAKLGLCCLSCLTQVIMMKCAFSCHNDVGSSYFFVRKAAVKSAMKLYISWWRVEY